MVAAHGPDPDGTRRRGSLIMPPIYGRRLVLSVTLSAGCLCFLGALWVLGVSNTSDRSWSDVVERPLTLLVILSGLGFLSAGGRVVVGEIAYWLRRALVLPVLDGLSDLDGGGR